MACLPEIARHLWVAHKPEIARHPEMAHKPGTIDKARRSARTPADVEIYPNKTLNPVAISR
jgi:hypothetical protein